MPPLALVVIKAIDTVWVLVVPGLASNTIGEVSVGTTDGQIEYEVELAIERGGVVLADPRVVEGGRELSSVEEALLGEIDLEDFISRVINVCEELFVVPIETIGVELCSQGFCVLVFLGSQLKAVLIIVGAPVESGSEPVVTLAGVPRSVTARLHNIDFTRCRPRSKLVSLGKHPNCGPEPVTLR